MNSTELAYRRTAADGAGGFGLLIALYDTLAGNLRRAADAQRRNDIQKRCRELGHALLVVGYLENWVDRDGGGELAQKLVAFYARLRASLIEAQGTQSAELLEQELSTILVIRGTWRDLELRASSVLNSSQESQLPGYPNGSMPLDEQTAYSWSA